MDHSTLVAAGTLWLAVLIALGLLLEGLNPTPRRRQVGRALTMFAPIPLVHILFPGQVIGLLISSALVIAGLRYLERRPARSS